MTTLIHVSNSQGTVGRCDARCYEASSAQCDCICGGGNHGKGEGTARENVAAYTRDQLRALEARGGFISDDVRQSVLL